jgi:peptide/nickel transport system ATP-binding protein
MREPAHPYTRGLLNSFPSLHGPRRELAGIPGSPPDLRNPLPGCPFIPRCQHSVPACTAVDMSLAPVGGPANGSSGGVRHLTACPIVTPEVSQEGVLW